MESGEAGERVGLGLIEEFHFGGVLAEDLINVASDLGEFGFVLLLPDGKVGVAFFVFCFEGAIVSELGCPSVWDGDGEEDIVGLGELEVFGVSGEEAEVEGEEKQ